MSLDDFLHIAHVTVADFTCIAVENFMKFVGSWEMFCYQLKECQINAKFVETDLLKGRLSRIMFHVCVFISFLFVVNVFQINITTRLL